MERDFEMRILLIYTNQEKWPVPVAPIGLTWVAGSLRAHGHEVRALDCMFLFGQRRIERELSRQLQEFQPELVGLSLRNIDNTLLNGTKFYLPQVRELIEAIRRQSAAEIVAGGAGFSLLAGEALRFLDLRYGIVGEGEVALCRLATCLEEGIDPRGIAGLVYRRGEEVVLNPPELISDIDQLPFPAADLVEYRRYVRQEGFVGIQSKRGCSFRCIYCEHPQIDGACYRLRTPKRVVDEMEEIRDRSGLSRFFFVDSVFSYPVEHALAICQEILDRRLHVSWYTTTNPSGITRELVAAMAAAGCIGVEVGIDVASDAMLRSLRKSFSKAEIGLAARLYQEAGIPASFHMLLGGPGETPDTVQESLDCLQGIISPADVLFVFGLRVYPHTDLFHQARPGDLIFTGEENDYLSPTFYLSSQLDREAVLEMESACGQYPQWSTPTNPWGYFSVLRGKDK